jgi:hypothetical protein
MHAQKLTFVYNCTVCGWFERVPEIPNPGWGLLLPACQPASQPSFVLSFVTVKVKNCSFFRKLLGRKQLSWVDDDVEGLI